MQDAVVRAPCDAKCAVLFGRGLCRRGLAAADPCERVVPLGRKIAVVGKKLDRRTDRVGLRVKLGALPRLWIRVPASAEARW